MRAVDPFGGPVGVVRAFPDGNAGFGFVDNEAAGVKGGLSVRGADADPDGDIANFQRTDSVDACGRFDFEALARFLEDPRPFFFGEWLVGAVFESVNGFAVVVVADPTFKRGIGAGCIV